jgi:hypothetical protein
MYMSKPTGLDLAALLAAEQVPGAPDLEVERATRKPLPSR